MLVKVVCVIIGVVLVAYLGISAWQAINLMQAPHTPLEDTPDSVGLTYEDVSFPSRHNDVTLKGWYIPGGPLTIIIVNGRDCNRIDPRISTLELSRDLVQEGYSILLFDQRGQGESEGKGVLLAKFDQDLGGTIDYLRSRGCQDIVILGTSLGAAESLIFASQEAVTAVISDSSFTTLREVVIRGADYPTPIVNLFWPGISLMVRILYGYSVVNPLDRVEELDCPVLFIHGETDDVIPVADAYRLFEASNNPSDELWVVPNAGHCEGYIIDPVGYVDKVTSFLEGLGG